MYLTTTVMPRGQSCWRLGLDDVPYYYLTMPRGQTCWRLGLVMYLITKVPRGQSCWRLGLADVPYYYFTMPRGHTNACAHVCITQNITLTDAHTKTHTHTESRKSLATGFVVFIGSMIAYSRHTRN